MNHDITPPKAIQQRDPSFIRGLLIPWFICLLAAVFYLYDFVLRVTPSIMIHPLMSNYHVDATSIGLLSAFYYYIYTPLQLPSGAVVDKYNRRLILTLSIFVCAIGGLLFAYTNNFYIACAARMMMGLGSAFAFVGALKLASLWLPHKHFALYGGITTALGTFGAIITDIVLSHSISAFGWRQTIYLTSYFGIGLGIIMLIFLRDKPKWAAKLPSSYGTWKNISIRLFKMLITWRMWVIGFVGAGLFLPVSVFASLWGVAFLERAYKLDPTHAAIATSLIFWGATLGFAIVGAISDAMKSRRKPLFIGSLLTLLLTGTLIYAPHLTDWEVYAILFAIGLFVSPQVLVFALAKEISPPGSTGLSAASTNFLVTMGAAVFQPLIGYFLDQNWNHVKNSHGMPIYSIHDFRMAFLTIMIILVLSFLVSFLLPKTRCRMINPAYRLFKLRHLKKIRRRQLKERQARKS